MFHESCALPLCRDGTTTADVGHRTRFYSQIWQTTDAGQAATASLRRTRDWAKGEHNNKAQYGRRTKHGRGEHKRMAAEAGIGRWHGRIRIGASPVEGGRETNGKNRLQRSASRSTQSKSVEIIVKIPFLSNSRVLSAIDFHRAGQ